MVDGRTRFKQLLKQMGDLFERKNKGYSPSTLDPWANFKVIEKTAGLAPSMGTYVRMCDKFIRVGNLLRDANNDAVGESIKDTLIDMANYCIIMICLLEEEDYARARRARPNKLRNFAARFRRFVFGS